MKYYKKVYSLFIITIFISLLFHGCGKLQDNLSITPASGIHTAGWKDVNSPSFHGKYIASVKWKTSECTICHGKNLRGGNSGKDCYACHSNGVTDCRLCHGSISRNTTWPPKALNGDTAVSYIGVGVHNIHMTVDSTKRNSARVRCISCHRQFNSFEDTLHIGNNPDNIAEIKFDSLALTTTPGIIPNPVWNRTNKTCSGTYCHGNFYNGNITSLPLWTSQGSLNCGSCHGDSNTGNPLPGGSHPPNYNINQCWQCHSSVIDTLGNIKNKFFHINGTVNYAP